MAKAAKKGIQKLNKYDITVQSNLSPDELFKMAINTPVKSLKAEKEITLILESILQDRLYNNKF